MLRKLLSMPIKTHKDLIIDGHHRYVASILAEYDIETAPSSATSATVKYDWGDVEFVIEEWDTPEKINMLNEMDAKYNNLTLKEIVEMLN